MRQTLLPGCMIGPSKVKRALRAEIERLRRERNLLREMFNSAERELAAERERCEDMEEALQRIVQWSEAYPLNIFPEPDLKRARELLEAGGITLDAVSASAMRHVIEEVGKIAAAAIRQSDSSEPHADNPER